MPQIQEYLPEQEAQGPVGQLSPMVEQVSMFGRGIEAAGRDLGDAYGVLHQRQTQAEASDAYANIAETRAQFAERIQKETADGTLDVERIKQDYQAYVDKQYDSYSTTGGRDAFNRASARAGGSLLQSAIHGKAIVMGNQAMENLTKISNTHSNLVEKDPHQFADLHMANVEAIQAQVDSGALSPQQARHIQDQMDTELAKGAIRGHINLDMARITQDVGQNGQRVDLTLPQYNQARQAMERGAFDSFLNSDQKERMMNEVKDAQRAATTAGIQKFALRRDANAAQGEAFKVDAYEKYSNGQLQADDINQAARKGLIDSDEQLRMLKLVEAQTKEEVKTNPRIYNQLRQNILSPDNAPGHIADAQQLISYVDAKQLSPKDFTNLQRTIQLVPSNRVNSFREHQLIEQARAKIGNDPDAEYRLQVFQNDLDQRKEQFKKDGKSVSDLLDPNSKDYFGNQIGSYARDPKAWMQAQANAARGQAQAPAMVDTRPGVRPSTTPPPAAIEPKPGGRGSFGDDLAQAWSQIKSGVGDLMDTGGETAGGATDFASRYNSSSAPKKEKPIEEMDQTELGALMKKKLTQAEAQRAAARWEALKGGK